MKKLFKSMNDSQYHFSLRKMNVGVCSVVLGLFFVGVNNTQTVKADVIQNTATQVQPKVQQKVTDSTNSNSTATTNGAEVTSVKETPKVEENNLNVSANNKETETVNSNSTVKSHEETLPKITEDQSKDNTNVEKTASELVKQSENNAQKQTQSVETNTLDLNNSNFKSNDNVATSLLASRAMFYYVPFSGWENHNGKLYYRNWDGSYIRNQWAAPTGTTHYFGREGYTINNQWYRMLDNNTYYFDHTGHTVK
ncbi:YSIRK-type signal peptide-containing protein, partial [Lactobacillus johnsonii]|uniref:YSIRK-type signal peptide-containing protein n=1 Tax=Lactobacillus johnsonii TaxID=33959 RepID=UPI000A679BFC